MEKYSTWEQMDTSISYHHKPRPASIRKGKKKDALFMGVFAMNHIFFICVKGMRRIDFSQKHHVAHQTMEIKCMSFSHELRWKHDRGKLVK